ncbi:hypothetical protein [Amycolatopsis suaedae]|uniref:Uncharacterized protein n=1 Tax=Amycolatopsis suaedae TaxID=2510978 RepID=A0A4Q7JEW8_9PSEU|nr:hypothetical protein [Amycolatopsis suaedae]RZQ65024.1 hypothetical protein EWH70_03735 [Amycolatopsis suaedae]
MALTRFPMYFEYFARTFRIDETPDGGMVGYLYNWRTGGFDPRTDLIDRVLFDMGHPEISTLSARDFADETERNRMRDLRGDGPIFALYDTIRGVYAQAKAEGRRLTEQEADLAHALRQRTFRMWEEDFARQAAGEPSSLNYRYDPNG